MSEPSTVQSTAAFELPLVTTSAEVTTLLAKSEAAPLIHLIALAERTAVLEVHHLRDIAFGEVKKGRRSVQDYLKTALKPLEDKVFPKPTKPLLASVDSCMDWVHSLTMLQEQAEISMALSGPHSPHGAAGDGTTAAGGDVVANFTAAMAKFTGQLGAEDQEASPAEEAN